MKGLTLSPRDRILMFMKVIL